ncbi:flagellar filament capping protein FliD [Nocardioides psychrotolerans]|uniref:flagellar filament capping protein FliD n=1 Tax=Nocardioides psychrotolerans TaxID=1005945 RepID=UPI003137A63D
MATTSISGLSSGLDTASIIDQLMQLEAIPQSRLKTRVATEQSLVTTLQTLNTKVAVLASRAEALAKPTAWAPLVSSSSDSDVKVTTGTNLAPTNLTVTVTAVAKTHQLGFATSAALTDQVTGASNVVRLDRFDGSPVDIDSGDGTLAGLVAAINDPGNATGLHAAAVRVADGQYRLLVESSATGAAQDFTLTAQDLSPMLGGATVRSGTDAAIDIGAGISVGSTTNTFADVVPGLTLTVAPETTLGTVSTISVTRDATGISNSVKGLVDAVNSLLTDIDTQSAAGSATKAKGPLSGDAGVRALRSAVIDSVFPTDGSSLADLGIEVDRYGKLTFDSAAFAGAYAADPAGVAEQFTSTGGGFADRVATVTKGASNPSDGTLTAAITGRNSGITRMKTSIDEWDQRLELRRTSLTRQFTALETALNQMTSQSSWLAGQLSSLPTNSSG